MIALAGVTWKEAVRQRFFSVLLLLGIGVVASALFFREFNFGASELKFVADFGFGGLTLFGSILAIVGTSQLFFGEIETRSVTTILAKPVRRGEFVVGKFLGIAMLLALYVLVLGAVIAAVLWGRERSLLADAEPAGAAASGLVSYASVALLAALQGIKFALLAAFTLLIASYARTNLFTVISGFVVLIICHLQPLAQEAWDRSGSLLARVVGGFLAVVFPNFRLFDPGTGVGVASALPPGDVAIAAAYGVCYVAVVLGLAVFSFSRREL
ncbi:MAG: ABC transporter permease [Opitutaceae bacterium]